MVTHGGLLDNLERARRRFGISEQSRGVTWLPPYHDMGLIAGTCQPIFSRFPAVILAPVHVMQRPARWLRAIEAYQATISGGPPFAYELCLTDIEPEESADLDLSSWELAFVGAEPVPFGLLGRFADGFARNGFRASAFAPCYGLAEATLMVSGRAAGTGAACSTAAGANEAPRTTCGHGIDGHDVRIVDPDTGIPCAEGEEGEIWVRGPGVAAGYWNNAEATATSFGARLADGEGPYLRTGDLGVLQAGELTVTGRIKELFIFAGRKLHAEDIEATVRELAARLEFGTAAAFTMEADATERLVVAVETRDRRRPDPADPDLAPLRREIAGAVQRRHGVPVYEVVALARGELPRTSSGKIRRRHCRDAVYGAAAEAVLA
jgi:acyl-CoA synthetase (AMP-forming)/AMP-acid ligase II